MADSFDVVVVGSGFGGGTTSLRLVQAGKSVCVLERGRWWRGKNLPEKDAHTGSTTFPQLGDSHFFWGREFWRPTRQRLGLFEIKQMLNLQGLVAAGVGGGSLIWANVVIEAPGWIFANNWPNDINHQVLEPYYRKADPYLRPGFVPGTPGIPDRRRNRFIHRSELLRQSAVATKQNWRPVRVAVNFGDESHAQPNGHGLAKQLGCNYCGLCSAGCPQNAKNTVDVTYIAEAEALGAEIRPLHLVTHIEPIAYGYRVHFKRFDLNGSVAAKGFVVGRKVVLAAGAFATTELLLRNKVHMPNLSAALGSRFSINGNVLGGALAHGKSNAAIDNNSGTAIASMVDYGAFAVEDFANPTWTAGIIGSNNVERIVAFAQAWASHKPSIAELERKVRDLLVYVGVGDDGAHGRLKLNHLGMLSLDWPGGIANEPGIKALHKAMADLAHTHGRTYVPNIFSIFNRPVTYHPLGGCPMADDPRFGVVDSFGRVFGYPGLYIADGSIVPTAIGRNPSYTIAALAERIVEQMIVDFDR